MKRKETQGIIKLKASIIEVHFTAKYIKNNMYTYMTKETHANNCVNGFQILFDTVKVRFG